MSGMYGSEVRCARPNCVVVMPSSFLRAEHLALLHAGPDGLCQQSSTLTPALPCVCCTCLSPYFSHVGLHPPRSALSAQACTASCLCPRQAAVGYGKQQLGTAGVPGLQVPEVIAAYREAGETVGSAPWSQRFR